MHFSVNPDDPIAPVISQLSTPNSQLLTSESFVSLV